MTTNILRGWRANPRFAKRADLDYFSNLQGRLLMASMRRLISAFMVCLAMNACEDGTSSDGTDDPALIGRWKGRIESKELKMFVNLKMEIKKDRTYLATGSPDMPGFDSLIIYEEKGAWKIVNRLFIAEKTSCRSLDQVKQELVDSPCPPTDTSGS
jgi:hypothetical protein